MTPFRNKHVTLLDPKSPDHPANNSHRMVRPWPWAHSDGYPPIVVFGGIVYADTGVHGDHSTRPRLYQVAPDVTLAE